MDERLRYITVYFLQGDLTKNVQVGAIQGSPEDPVNPGIVGMEQSLGGNAVCNEPNAQEEEEEENVLHLWSRNRPALSFI